MPEFGATVPNICKEDSPMIMTHSNPDSNFHDNGYSNRKPTLIINTNWVTVIIEVEGFYYISVSSPTDNRVVIRI